MGEISTPFIIIYIISATVNDANPGNLIYGILLLLRVRFPRKEEIFFHFTIFMWYYYEKKGVGYIQKIKIFAYANDALSVKASALGTLVLNSDRILYHIHHFIWILQKSIAFRKCSFFFIFRRRKKNDKCL